MLISTPLVLIYALRCLKGSPDRAMAFTAVAIAVTEAVFVGIKVVEYFSWSV